MMFPTKFRFICQSGFRGYYFIEINQLEARIVCGSHLLTVRDELSNLYRGPAKEASYHVSVHLAKCFQRGRFLKIDPSETIIAYGGHIC
jgi:hypothetical protein